MQFCGEFYNTLDEKGRIAFPAKFKMQIPEDEIWITKGINGEKALLIYTIKEWEKTLKELESVLSIYNPDTRKFYRMFIAPAQKVQIDKNGRILIPQSLREYALLQKDCVFLGMNRVIELWDVEKYNESINASEINENIFALLEKSKMLNLGGGEN